MHKRIAKFMLSDFAKSYDYDVGYLEHMAEVSPGAFYRYLLCTPFATHRKKAPPKSYLITKLVATKYFDCGPCLRLVINMAREAKIDDKLIHAALLGNESELPEDLVVARRYAIAVTEQDAAALLSLEEKIVQRWGEGALTEMAVAVAFAAFFPILRRGMGHAHSCEPVIQELTKLLATEGSVQPA